jgi:hypothetical protein
MVGGGRKEASLQLRVPENAMPGDRYIIDIGQQNGSD